jgi:NAD(P)-dependent dehydrogenase (short-subunit alcohol dehydrogenase family)
MGDIDAISGEDWRVSMLVNVEGALNCLRALLPSLRDAGRTSSVVIVSSTEGLRGAPFHVAYTTSKHAVVGLVRSASKSLGADGIRVNVVCPGTMDTPMFRNAMSTAPQGTREAVEAATALGYVAEPVEIGRVIAFLLSTDASYVTGATIVVDGGLLAI